MKYGMFLTLFLLLLGCNQHQHPVTVSGEAEPAAIAVTNWTSATELFMEYPPLVVGQKGRAAVHFTDLQKFVPVTAGVVSIDLEQEGRIVQSFKTNGPSRPGIFGIDLEPAQAGSYSLSVQLSAPSVTDRHELGEVTVYPNASQIVNSAASPHEESIPFLKEQQWTLDFATEVATNREIRDSLVVTGEVAPRSGGDVMVVSPITGQIVISNRNLPIGGAVRAGEELVRIAPHTPEPADLPNLQLEIEEAKSHLEHTRRDRERAERLTAVGAAPQKRLHEAQEEETLMAARLKAAEARLALYEANRKGGGSDNASSFFTVQSPIAGVIASTAATPGKTTTQGEALFRIVAIDPVYVLASLPEAEVWRVPSITGAEIEIPGLPRPLPMRRRISDSRVIDPQTRTLNLIYEVGNPERRLAIGQSLSIRLFFSQLSSVVAIPEGAVVDDGGRPVAFVQLEGEKFARRPITLGARAGGYVQVNAGIKAGERVVSRGAYLIRLAALSPTIPAHGHAH